MENLKNVRWKQRLQNFEKAYVEFQNSCNLKSYSKLERSGFIQTFEFTFELAWKTLQDLLQARGYTGTIGPRPVIEQAFQNGILQDGESWMKMLESRNLTAHCYDEKIAEEIAHQIKTEYFRLISQLVEYLRVENIQLSQLNLPYQFDLLDFDHLENSDLREHIERVGKVIFQR